MLFENFDILNFIKSNYVLIISLILVGVMYLILEFIFGKKKEKPKEEEVEEVSLDDIENKYKIKKGYTEHTSSYVGPARSDYSRNGGSSRITDYNRKKTFHKKEKEDLDEKYSLYAELFYSKRVSDISELARAMKMPNNKVIKDIKNYKKKGKFQDIKIDEVESKITYINDMIDKNEEVFYYNENKTQNKKIKEIKSGVFSHKCPECGTENLINQNDVKYHCYYCLKEIII